MATLDHLILKVNDLAASIRFYTEVLGFVTEGTDGPFTMVGFEAVTNGWTIKRKS